MGRSRRMAPSVGSSAARNPSTLYQDGDCRVVYTYDPFSEENKNDKLWLDHDPYQTNRGAVCLNGFKAGTAYPDQEQQRIEQHEHDLKHEIHESIGKEEDY